MNETIFIPTQGSTSGSLDALRTLLHRLSPPYSPKERIGIKLHWGEQGNKTFLPPDYAREIVSWLKELGTEPFVFDTTVLYSGGRRQGEKSLETAYGHGYTESFLGCPLIIGDGLDGRQVKEIPAGFKHYSTVQVADILDRADGFLIFSHFKGHLACGFGGAIKNISMGFASRAQKQRMHSEAKPVLNQKKCTKCGICVEVCPAQAATMRENEFPHYDLKACVGCAQCIAQCPQVALRILWETDAVIFQEKLIETAAALWRIMERKTLVINALLNIARECDCLTGNHPLLAPDLGFLGGYHPVSVDQESLNIVGADRITEAHPKIPWRRQFSYAEEIGFTARGG